MGALGNASRGGLESKTRRGAADALIWLMRDALLFCAKNANLKTWLDAKLAEADEWPIDSPCIKLTPETDY